MKLRKRTLALTAAVPLVLVCSALFLVPKLEAQPPNQVIPFLPTTNGSLRAKAQPDECFSIFGIGYNLPFTKPPCFFATPKVNQAYIWGITDGGIGELWFGTVANPQCVTEGGLAAASTPPNLNPVPYKTDSWVCDFGKSPYSPVLLPPIVGDFRPPQMFYYNKSTLQLTEVTPKVPVSSTNPLGLDPLVESTLGIHAAVTIGNTVLLAGESLLLNGINLFAFNATTHQYLGSSSLPGYSNIRQFVTLNGNVYAAVAKSGATGGAVLKYNGQGLFGFDVVGNLDGQGAYIASHQGRLYVGTWPVPGVLAGIYMSPVVPVTGGLTTANAGQWVKVWDVGMYEADPVVASTYAMGAMASYNGYLHWGTLHIPWQATQAALTAYGTPTTDNDWLGLAYGTFRTISIFRGRNFDTTPAVDLLFGYASMPAYSAQTAGHWPLAPNKLSGNKNPLFGVPGFGSAYNTYTWSMTVWNNKLWIGSMNWSFTAQQGTQLVTSGAGGVPPNLPPSTLSTLQLFFLFQNYGAGLYSLDETKAFPLNVESNTGVGNLTNIGIRNMIVSGNSLYLGMANASNLLTFPIGPQGGWELIELKAK